MTDFDKMSTAELDLFLNGEDEEWQDGTPPPSQRGKWAIGSSTASGSTEAEQLRGAAMDTELPIERLPATEEAAGVALAGLFAVSTDLGDEGQRSVQVSGELSAPTKQPIGSLAVIAAVYDASGRVLGTVEHHYFDGFPGWDAFAASGFVPGTPAKVRVFIRRT